MARLKPYEQCRPQLLPRNPQPRGTNPTTTAVHPLGARDGDETEEAEWTSVEEPQHQTTRKVNNNPDPSLLYAHDASQGGQAASKTS